MRSLSLVGHPVICVGLAIIIGIIGEVCQNHQIVIAAIIVVAVVALNGLLKIVFHRARPSTYHTNSKLWFDIYSFPSGHTSGSTASFGLLAYITWQLTIAPYNVIAVCFLSALIIGVGLSRIKVGAHYPTDVIAGWLLGLIGLGVIIGAVGPLF